MSAYHCTLRQLSAPAFAIKAGRLTAGPSRAAIGHATRTTQLQRRVLSVSASLRSRQRDAEDGDDGDAGFNRPGPPPLPPKEQREFERLVREKANAPQFKPASMTADKHPQYRAKPVPEFEGDVNPNTGEVGGPKNDPLRWQGEWTYGGRSTDF